ncbi:BnaCnng26100D [Brassica napus]|uniref:BnaCnng26100D protein n=1 Tax=Brassica napus TaxID=3708 RepID=A0A078IVN2_BRANA|nr:BnaCnng26100D [Brassica napus]
MTRHILFKDEDAADGGCLDDWEAFADALAADEQKKHDKENPPEEQSASLRDSVSGSNVPVRDVKPSRKQKSNQAWRADDKLRPQGLPNLGKQRSFPVMNLHFSSEAVPSSCPICYEDLDLTDSNFLPCPCGFRLCLFCHKTICDGDGRCPGCRKPYEKNTIKVETSVQNGGLTIRLARSSSMFCSGVCEYIKWYTNFKYIKLQYVSFPLPLLICNILKVYTFWYLTRMDHQCYIFSA